MNNFEKLKSMTVSELADWLDKYGQFDGSPWMAWFNTTYCSKCESIKCQFIEAEEKLDFKPFFPDKEIQCAYCELEKHCKFFPELKEVPDIKTTITLWLKEDVKNDRN